MPDIERIGAAEAHRKVEAGEALLVCAYDDEQKCAGMKLEGSITMAELRRKLSSLPPDREIILYCG
jgi:hypothetical protein